MKTSTGLFFSSNVAGVALLALNFSLALPSAANAQRSREGSREGARGGSVDVQTEGYGRFQTGSVSATSANGATYDASGTRAGRFSTSSTSATGANGATYNSSTQRAGQYGTRSVDATGANGATYNSTTTRTPTTATRSVNGTTASGQNYSASYSGYRTGYVYRGGAYVPASITVNRAYVAPVGVYAGWTVVAQPYYVSVPAFATYPVEVAVQVQLKRLGYYGGTVDGVIGPGTQQAIARFQGASGLAVTGNINQATVRALGIS